VVAQLRNECWPIFLHEPLAHEGDALEQNGGNPVVSDPHQQAHEVLLHDLKPFLVDKIGGVVFVISESLLFLAPGNCCIVVGILVLL